MHLPAQPNSPAGQLVAHWPLEHACPAAHGLPHAPQCWTSRCVLAQTPPQSVSPAWQESAQAPAEQTWPAAQASPAAAPVQAP